MLEGYHAAGAQQVILPVFGRSRDEMLQRHGQGLAGGGRAVAPAR